MRIIIVCYILILCSAFYLLNLDNRKDQQALLDRSYKLHEQRLDEVIFSFKVNSDVTFENLIMTPAVLGILEQVASADQEGRNRLRNKLHALLLKPYNNLRELAHVRQLHFHLPDSSSFLRMHRPEKFGDPLKDVRYSVMLANRDKIIVQGFEEGRIHNGYRFVYPISYNSKHLGTVEISVAMSAITESLQNIYAEDYCFILSSEVIGKKVFEDMLSNYSPSPFGDDFAMDKEVQNLTCAGKTPYLGELLKDKSISAEMKLYKPINRVKRIYGQCTILHMVPLLNVQQQAVAYIYIITSDSGFEALNTNFKSSLIFTFLGCSLVAGMLIRFRKNQQDLRQQKAVLEKKVQKRTLFIKAALQKERYIKKVLLTIFNVSEHLNTAVDLDQLVSDTCRLITENKLYSFAHIRLVDKLPSELVSKISEKQGMSPDILENFYGDLEQNERISSQLQERQVIIDNSLPTQPYAEKINDFIATRDIQSMTIIPLCGNKAPQSPFSYMLLLSSETHDLEEERILFQELGKALSQSILLLHEKSENEVLQQDKMQSYRDMIYAMMDLIEKRDAYTAGHTRRVTRYCLMLGKAMQLDKQTMLDLEEAAMLHDIGKIVIPDSILLKPGKLDAKEYNLIKEHVAVGAEILGGIKLYSRLRDIMMYHHEKYDGSGYPFGLRGEKIPLLARVMTIADAFDAMTTNRIYKPRKSVSEAIDELIQNKDSHFDPHLVDLASGIFKDVVVEQAVTQLPKSGPDYERMAYYFKDRLTGLYNQDYLKIIIRNDEMLNDYAVAILVMLHQFTEYNAKMGWKAGNELLKKVADTLNYLADKSFMFRVFGDDFIIIVKDENYTLQRLESDLMFLSQEDLKFSTKSFHLHHEKDRNQLTEMIDKQE